MIDAACCYGLDPDSTGIRTDVEGRPLVFLRLHGRATTRQIADACGMTPKVVWQRCVQAWPLIRHVGRSSGPGRPAVWEAA